MARTKAVLGNGTRLTDYLSTSLLARIYPASVINELLDAHQCNSQLPSQFSSVGSSLLLHGINYILKPLMQTYLMLLPRG